jgi:hypothetical protein
MSCSVSSEAVGLTESNLGLPEVFELLAIAVCFLVDGEYFDQSLEKERGRVLTVKLESSRVV